MVNSLLKFVVMMVFCQLAVSALREEDFRKSLDGNYPEKFLYQLLNNQIKHRAGYLTEISGQTSFSEDDYSFINTTIGTIESLIESLDSKSETVQSVKEYATSLIDAVGLDIERISKDHPFDISDIYRRKVFKFSLENLNSLRSEIESLEQLSENLTIATLEELLRRFDLILRLVVDGPLLP